MEGDAGRGLECQRSMVGRGNIDNGLNKTVVIPSCCLKASAFEPEIEAKCRSAVVSG